MRQPPPAGLGLLLLFAASLVLAPSRLPAAENPDAELARALQAAGGNRPQLEQALKELPP